MSAALPVSLPIFVRTMREEDGSEVIAIAARVPTAPHWPDFEFRRMLTVAEDDPRRCGAWVATSCTPSEAAAQDAAMVQGFAMASHAGGTAEIEAVVTSPGYRRKGVGSALLGAAIAWSRGAGAKQLLLEARASNGEALRLYSRLGFEQDGLRRGYYRNPDEDAVLLSLRLNERAEGVFGGFAC